jgi:hypothetical protein
MADDKDTLAAAVASPIPVAPGLVMLDERSADLNLLPSVPKERQPGAIITIIVVLLLAGLGVALIATTESMREDLNCFFEGHLVECKTAGKLALEKKWKAEDLRARPNYGDLALTYFPGDLQLKITQRAFAQEGLDGTPSEAVETDIPSGTEKLKPGQTYERLPIMNLPIYETQKRPDGSVEKAFSYEYVLHFAKDGYYPRTIVIYSPSAPATGKPVEGAQALLWTSLGPGNHIIQWPGLDLVPTPETVRKNLVEVVKFIFCSLRWHLSKGGTVDVRPADLPKVEMAMVEGYSPLRRDTIFKRNGFRGVDDFVRAWESYTVGTHLEWWTAQATAIAASTCDNLDLGPATPLEPEKKPN